MKTPQQIKNEVEKEIKDLEETLNYRIDLRYNGDVEKNKAEINKIELEIFGLHSKLSILTEYDKSIKEMIEDFFIKEDVILKKVDNKIAYLMISRNISHKEERDELIKLRQELLLKIGDDSEVEK